MNIDLARRLQAFNAQLTELEQANFKLLLGLAASGLAPKTAFAETSDVGAFETVTHTLIGLQPYHKRISSNGIAFQGRPPFMTEELLCNLQGEAKRIRPKARKAQGHSLGCGAPIANRLAIAAELCDFVREYAGDVNPTGIASFLFYDEVGQGIDAHIDTDIFSLNVLFMLEHQRELDNVGSCLVVFPPGEQAERIDLKPGEAVIMFAGSIAHARERIAPGERVTVLTFGFHPLGV